MNELMDNSILRTAYHNKKGDLIIKNSGFYVDENNKLVEIDIPNAYKIALEALEKQIPKEIVPWEGHSGSGVCPKCGVKFKSIRVIKC